MQSAASRYTILMNLNLNLKSQPHATWEPFAVKRSLLPLHQQSICSCRWEVGGTSFAWHDNTCPCPVPNGRQRRQSHFPTIYGDSLTMYKYLSEVSLG